MKRVLLLAVIFISAAAAGESPAPAASDELAQNLFAPDLVLKYRQEIGLDDSQSKSLKELVQKAQSKFLDVQWDMQAEATKLGQLLRAPRIEETAALAQAGKVLGMERQVKEAQLSLLIRIKNLLTPAQQDKLVELRRENP
jgi:Spy/CpxP family protein refolding chaperone